MSQILLCRLGDRTFGLEIVQVQEIVESPSLHFIPRAPAIFAGAMNFHGRVVPVLDLGTFLGFPGGTHDSRIIVLPSDLCSLALAVAAVGRIVPLDLDDLSPYRETDGANLPVHAVLERSSEFVYLIDIAGLLARLGEIDWRR